MNTIRKIFFEEFTRLVSKGEPEASIDVINESVREAFGTGFKDNFKILVITMTMLIPFRFIDKLFNLRGDN